MDKPPEKFRFAFESSDEDEESSKKTTKKAKKIGGIGALASSGVSKNEISEEEKEKPKSVFDRIELDDQKDTKESEPEDEESVELPDVEAHKNKVIEEETEAEIATLDSVIEASAPGLVENIEAVTLQNFVKRLNQKATDPTTEADPKIDEEFERRKAEITAEDLEDIQFTPDETIEANETSTEDEEVPEQPVTIRSSVINAPSSTEVPTEADDITSSPVTPVTPPSPASPPPYIPFGAGARSTPSTPESISSPTTSTRTVERTTSPEIDSRRNNNEFLIGGVLGYMVGRRGGRKRTERRLQPEINKLTSEVETTKLHLAGREAELRKIASEKIREYESSKREAAPSTTRKPVHEILRQTITAPENVTISSHQAAEQKPKQPEVTSVPETTIKKIEQYSTPELLQAAESMFVSGISVRSLYESNRIDRVGLVRVVQEGLRGNNITDVFEKVELGRERQRERAREFRHDDPGFVTNAQTLGTSDSSSIQTTRPSAPLAVPNNPDPDSLTPLISNAAPLNIPKSDEPAKSDSPKPDTKLSTTSVAAIFALGLGLLFVWLLLTI